MFRAAHAPSADGKSWVEAVDHALVRLLDRCNGRRRRFMARVAVRTPQGYGTPRFGTIQPVPVCKKGGRVECTTRVRRHRGGSGDTFARAFDSRTAHQAAIVACVRLGDGRNTGVVPFVFGSQGGSAAIVEPPGIRQTRVSSLSR